MSKQPGFGKVYRWRATPFIRPVPASSVTITDAQGSGTLAYLGSRSVWVTAGTFDPVRYRAFLNRARRLMRQIRRRKPRRLTRWYAKQRRKAR